MAEGTRATTRSANIRKSLATRIPLLPAELVRIRPICTEVRADTLWDCGCLGERSIRIQDERTQHEDECRDAHPAKQPYELTSPH